jgi:hypothetical protein
VEDRAQFAADMAEDRLWHNTTWYLQSHLEWARL